MFLTYYLSYFIVMNALNCFAKWSTRLWRHDNQDSQYQERIKGTEKASHIHTLFQAQQPST